MATQAAWIDVRRAYLERVSACGIHLTLKERVWALTDQGEWLVLPGVTATSNPDHWWLGYDRETFREKNALGAILLCASPDGALFDFGLPAEVLRAIEPELPLGSQRQQVYFNVFRRGTRFVLQLKGGRDFDITSRRGDLSWLRMPGSARRTDARSATDVDQPSMVAEGVGAASSTVVSELRFFARATNGALEPLDPPGLGDGEVYLVIARKADGIPTGASLRRILARGGPADLPADFAEQHDHYAHGAPKR